MTNTMALNPRRIARARLEANMSRGDLAYAIRRVTDGQIKATERGIRRWEKGENRPSDGVVPAIAAATGREIEWFYRPDEDDEEESEAVRDALDGLMAALRAQVEASVRRAQAKERISP